MKAQGRRILMLVDNCSARPPVTLSNVKLHFLPPNTTSKLQPCDAGIIQTVKAHYRKRLLRHILVNMDEASSATELAKTVNILHAIRWLDLAWCSLKVSTIQKCFTKCGYVSSASETVESAEEMELETFPLDGGEKQLLEDVSWNDFVNMDRETGFVNPEPETIPLATQPQDHQSASEDDEEEERSITTKEALSQAGSLLNFAEMQGNVELVNAAFTLKSMLEDVKLREAGQAKQTGIQDFFKSS
ncbi:tigger transposable element-derived protein 6-like [Littorina saxatilis]